MVYQQPGNFNDFMHYTDGLLRHYHERLHALEETVDQLANKIDALNTREPIQIHYSFDQLKIEKLDGTLNIGIKPGEGENELNEFLVSHNAVSAPGDVAYTSPHQMTEQKQKGMDIAEDIQHYFDDYFREDVFQDLLQLEEKHRYPLDQPYRQFIVQDVRRQLLPRIDYYIKNAPLERMPKEAVITEVIQRVRADVLKAFDNFISHIPKGKGDSS
ncbi:putative spore germination protein GerPC [Pullulanibacillus camelliae]|uniref:Putative spore germination protein GerPC n=1 Tax=Pullulanibacillus camelliae TaxID=1707096 RepID=A0A8J2VSB8_9BACL|nr:spore germination protein GerPC [Pullulanibacillus camelliae]GGE39192.1 putative spore germination protein GerPC [Pullulanibacillus camelliae]